MKKILLIIVFFMGFTSFGQNLTLNDLINLRKKNIVGVEEFLTTKNWEFVEAKRPQTGLNGNVIIEDGSMVFSYNRDKYSDRAEAFVSYSYSNEDAYHNRIFFQMSNLSKYNEILNAVKKLNPKLVDSYVDENGDVKKVYQGKTTTFIFTTSVSKGSMNISSSVYYLTILDNNKYNFINMIDVVEEATE